MARIATPTSQFPSREQGEIVGGDHVELLGRLLEQSELPVDVRGRAPPRRDEWVLLDHGGDDLDGGLEPTAQTGRGELEHAVHLERGLDLGLLARRERLLAETQRVVDSATEEGDRRLLHQRRPQQVGLAKLFDEGKLAHALGSRVGHVAEPEQV